jgi:hypothetical protein
MLGGFIFVTFVTCLLVTCLLVIGVAILMFAFSQIGKVWTQVLSHVLQGPLRLVRSGADALARLPFGRALLRFGKWYSAALGIFALGAIVVTASSGVHADRFVVLASEQFVSWVWHTFPLVLLLYLIEIGVRKLRTDRTS